MNPLVTDMNQGLDLNLGIAPPYTSDPQKENDNSSNFAFQRGWDGLPVERGARVMSIKFSNPKV